MSLSQSDKELIEAVSLRTNEKEPHPQLSRADWLEAAIGIFLEKGIDAVRITHLAESLNVTRGSFYWHFKDRDDLLQGIVKFWRDKSVVPLIQAIEDATTLEDGILSLFDIWLNENRITARLDLSMRSWGLRSSEIEDKVREVDASCIESFRKFFILMGCDVGVAEARARTLYFCQVGYYSMRFKETVGERVVHAAESYHILTGEHLSRAALDEFVKKYDKN